MYKNQIRLDCEAKRMEYRREEIMPGVFLSALHTDKFKSSAMCVTLLSQLDHEHAYLDALIPSVLRRGTVSHPDMSGIMTYLEELYGATAVPITLGVGEVKAMGFYSAFPEGRFLPGGRSELADVSKLLGELLLAPNTRGGLLLPDYVNSERSKLAERIRASKNDRITYAFQRLIELMCSYEDYSASILSDPDEAESIHYTRLTRRYRELLATSPVEVFYCGAEDFNTVREAVLPALSALPRGELDFDIGTDVRMNAIEDKPRRFFETMDVGQGKLVMGWRLGDCMEEPDFAAMRVFNAVYGGTASSKLFREMREARSLCYYASSGIDDVKGLLYVHSGIDKANYDVAVEGICAELDKIKRGEISDDELSAARRYCSQALRLVVDDPVELMMHYLKMNIIGAEISPEELAAACEGVTAGEIAEIAAGTDCDAIYFLSGEDEEASVE